MKTGYVAFLDVLGFTSMIANDQQHRISEYLAALSTALDSQDGPTSTGEYLVFSDSIVVTVQDEPSQEDNLRAILRGCSYLFGEFLKVGIPIRGAISYGKYQREPMPSKGRFVAGRAVLEAHHFEGQQDWVGIMLAPSVVDHATYLPSKLGLPSVPSQPNEFPHWATRHFECARWDAYVAAFSDIPFRSHGGGPTSYDGYAIKPSGGDARMGRVRESLETSLMMLRRLKMLAPDPTAQRKYQRTLDWLTPISGNWNKRYLRATSHDEEILAGMRGFL